MSLRVEKAGLLDTVQDAGRYGFACQGINPSGAMDPAALALANFLVGNAAETAALECHFPAPALRFEQAVLFALSGADFNPVLNGVPVAVHRPLWAPAGALLQFKKRNTGARGYLAVRGGFDLPAWLGSRSTNRAARAGGFEGRALRPG
ncbi:MAG: biotin-dependent carboxyltransferase family protein, partial [Saprospiraceae bacterium]|nr:biotin-dependent carboxyltransferase family protein [Saprospiraceae bacterium]